MLGLSLPRDSVVPERRTMRKAVHIRIRLDEAEGRHVRDICLKENRSTSATVSLLVAEALAARRQAAAEQAEMLQAVQSAKVQQIIDALRTPTRTESAQ